MKKIIFTCGDTNGIGPEVAVKTLQKLYDLRVKEQIIFISPVNVFIKYYHLTYSGFPFHVLDRTNLINSPERIIIYGLPEVNMTVGKPTKQSGKTAYLSLTESYDLLKDEIADAVVTAPVSKYALKLAGVDFPGQTEMFASWCNEKNFMMTFLSSKMNAGLMTIHTPLKKVSSTITSKSVSRAIELISKTAKTDLGIKDPKIAVLGLNPHSGENGLIGNEEIKFIQPVLQNDKYSTFADGPFPADAFFAMRKYKDYDFVLGMYHDQVLIPFKLLNFNTGVNYTAGLPVVRTSPDHGSAFDIAGNNLADESSFYSAYLYAKKIVQNRKKNKSNKSTSI